MSGLEPRQGPERVRESDFVTIVYPESEDLCYVSHRSRKPSSICRPRPCPEQEILPIFPYWGYGTRVWIEAHSVRARRSVRLLMLAGSLWLLESIRSRLGALWALMAGDNLGVGFRYEDIRDLCQKAVTGNPLEEDSSLTNIALKTAITRSGAAHELFKKSNHFPCFHCFLMVSGWFIRC